MSMSDSSTAAAACTELDLELLHVDTDTTTTSSCRPLIATSSSARSTDADIDGQHYNEHSNLQQHPVPAGDDYQYGSIPLVIEFETGTSTGRNNPRSNANKSKNNGNGNDDDDDDDSIYPNKSRSNDDTCRFFSVSTIRSLVIALLLFVFFSTHHSTTTSTEPASLQGNPLNSVGTQASVVELLGHQKHPQEEWKVPHYYHHQLVDHFANTDTRTWPNRYYVSTKDWKGPGHPIFVIMGGEGPVDGVFYKFVMNDLAHKFHAYVLQTEHRFYGTTFPYHNGKSPSNDEFDKYLSPAQALQDYVRIIRHMQSKLNCSMDRSSRHYCPIITVGASYPGFLSAMMRFVYPDVVDMAYASSAPIRLYSREETHQYLYFDHVTKVAEAASPGCAAATEDTLRQVYQAVKDMPIQKTAKKLGICKHIPKYITTSAILAKELTMMTGFSFADFNMDYYPPGDSSTDLIKACKCFQGDKKKKKTPLEKFADYLVVKAEAVGHSGASCYDLAWDIPDGPNATITGSDWTGMGDGYVGNAWEFQCCKTLIVNAGFSPESMFLDQPFDLDWLTDHCQSRFGVGPQPYGMVNNWKFDDMVAGGGSYILFTNGMNDGWSVFSHTRTLSDTMIAVNLPSGAHHSELNSIGRGQKEADDIVEGRKQIAKILGGWIDIVKQQRQQAFFQMGSK